MFKMEKQQWLTVQHMELCSMLWQPGQEESLGENWYMHVYEWVPLLSTWNCHNTINQVCAWVLSRVWLCDPMDCSMPDFPVLHSLPEFAQTHVHWVSDATQPSHSLSPPSPLALNLSQHQGLFQWVGSSHHCSFNQSFQWIFRIDFL